MDFNSPLATNIENIGILTVRQYHHYYVSRFVHPEHGKATLSSHQPKHR